MADHDPEEEMARGAQDEALLALILEAFAVARRAGKDDWHRMYAGPLKNRILLLCGGQLSEPEWESTPFTKLLTRFPETLSVDFEQTPPLVELRKEGRLESEVASPESDRGELAGDVARSAVGGDQARRWRLRNDLWDSVMGIRDPDVFLWKNDEVVRAEPEEADRDPDALRLPTLTGEELDTWQKEFATELSNDERYRAVVESWGRGESPTSALPRHLQHLWYGRLKTLVRDRLETWFDGNGIARPQDLVQIPSTQVRPHTGAPTAMRIFIQKCVAAMTEEELADVRIPAGVAMRVHR